MYNANVTISAQKLCGSRGGRVYNANVTISAQKLCESRGGRVYNANVTISAQKLCGSRGGRPGLHIPHKLHGFCRRKATCKKKKMPSPHFFPH